MSARKDGKTAVTILLNEQDVEALRLIMEADSRETMADCIRAIVRSTAKKILRRALRRRNRNHKPHETCGQHNHQLNEEEKDEREQTEDH